MKIPAWRPLVALVIAALAGRATSLSAQGVTTGAVAGTVTNEQGQPVEAAQVQVVNHATGYRSGTRTRSNGYYLIQGLEVGGPYTLSVRRIGLEPRDIENISVSLSQTTRVDVQLGARAVNLAGVQVTSTSGLSTFSPSHQGVGTAISDSIISRMPMLGRNFTTSSSSRRKSRFHPPAGRAPVVSIIGTTRSTSTAPAKTTASTSTHPPVSRAPREMVASSRLKQSRNSVF
jgi:hypothetical protein